MYQSSNVRTNGRNQTSVKIKKVQYILLYQTNAFLMAGKERIELSIMVLETMVIPFNYFPINGSFYKDLRT